MVLDLILFRQMLLANLLFLSDVFQEIRKQS